MIKKKERVIRNFVLVGWLVDPVVRCGGGAVCEIGRFFWIWGRLGGVVVCWYCLKCESALEGKFLIIPIWE